MATKEPKPRSPAAARDPVFIWPTPLFADVLFYVEKKDLPKYSTWEYGDAYLDTVKYPDHKLIHVSPQTTDGWSRWYYAKDRDDEDTYNWDWTAFNAGGVSYHAVKRIYLALRSEFVEDTPAMRSAMPATPADVFDGTYILAKREQSKTGDAVFDGLYVIDVRTYAKFTEVVGQNYDHRFGVGLPYTQNVIAEGLLPDESDVTPIDTHSAVARTIDVAAIQAALAEIDISWETTRRVSLPNTISNLRVLASRVLSTGTGAGRGSGVRFNVSSHVGVSADVAFDLEEGYNGPVPATIRTFFVPEGTSGIFDGFTSWPTYAPKGMQYVVTSFGVTKSYQASMASDGAWSASESASVRAGTATGYVPSSLHAAAAIPVDYTDYTAPVGPLGDFIDQMEIAAAARVDSIAAAITAGLTVYGVDCSTAEGKAAATTINEANEDYLNFVDDLTLDDASVSVSPATLTATDITSVQTGDFLVDSSIEIYGYGMLKVTTVTVTIS